MLEDGATAWFAQERCNNIFYPRTSAFVPNLEAVLQWAVLGIPPAQLSPRGQLVAVEPLAFARDAVKLGPHSSFEASAASGPWEPCAPVAESETLAGLLD